MCEFKEVYEQSNKANKVKPQYEMNHHEDPDRVELGWAEL